MEAVLFFQSTVFPVRVDFLFVVVCSAVLSLVASHRSAQSLLIIGSQQIVVEEMKFRVYRTLSNKDKSYSFIFSSTWLLKCVTLKVLGRKRQRPVGKKTRGNCDYSQFASFETVMLSSTQRPSLTPLKYLQSLVNSNLSTQQLHAYLFINLIQMSSQILYTYYFI